MPAKISQDSRSTFILHLSLRSVLRPLAFISSIFILTFFLPTIIFAEEIIKNSGFESGLEHWQDKVSGATIEESSEAHSGNKSIKITKSSNGSGGAQQTISGLEIGNFYKIAAKAKRVSETGSGKLRIAWYEEGSTSQKDTIDSSIIDSSNWSTIEMVFQVPENVATAKVRLFATSTDDKPASMLFDDLEISVTQPTSTPAPSPTPTVMPTQQPTPTSTPSPTPIIEPESTETQESSFAENITTVATTVQDTHISPTTDLQPEAKILGATAITSEQGQASVKSNAKMNPLAFIVILVGVGMLATAGYIYARDSGMLSQVLHRSET